MPPNDLEVAQSLAQEFGLKAASVTFIDAGFSLDRKFYITANSGEYLLRFSELERETERRLEFESLQKLFAAGIPCSQPYRFGLTADSCYCLYSYIPGECAETALPRLSPTNQRDIGLDSGRLLARIHQTLPGDGSIDECELRGAKFRTHRAVLRAQGVTYKGQAEAEAFVEANLPLIEDRPITFRQGDFHPGNLIVENGRLAGVIDFNRCDFGDPYDDFYKTAYFGAPLSEEYATGLIQGYFGGDPPPEFWPIYNLYVAAVLPSDIVWAQVLYPERVQEAMDRVELITRTHDFVGGQPPQWWKNAI